MVERYPHAPSALLDIFVHANETTERYHDDPNWSRLVWGRLDIEEERRLLGCDLWPAGVAKNRANLERFIGYSHDQGSIDRPLSVDASFESSVRDT